MSRARRIGLVILVLVILAGALGLLWPGRSESSVGMRLPGVVEIQEIRPASKIGGRVEEVLVTEGSLVEPDQELVRIEVPELTARRDQAKARLVAAEAALEKALNGPRKEEIAAARAMLAAANARHERMLAGWRSEEIRQARADLDAANADAQLTRMDYDRISQLYMMGTGLGRSEYDAALAAYERAKARQATARAKLDMMQAGNRSEDKAEAAAEAAKAKADLDLLEAGTRPEDKTAARAAADEARANLDELEVQLREAVVRAPDRALVEVLAVRKGDVLAPNAPVARLLRARDLWVRVYVPETELGRIRLGQKAEVTMDTAPDRRFPGIVIQVGNIAEFTPRNVQTVEGRRSQVFGVKVRVEDPDGIFKSGMAAEVWLPDSR